MSKSKKIVMAYTVLFALTAILFTAGDLSAKGKVLMKGVPQDLGMADIAFNKLKESLCKDCHGSDVADKHHSSKKAIDGKCTACHSVSKGKVSVQNNCMKCHKESPHHQTKAAKDKLCDECHDEGVSEYGKGIGKSKPSRVTPTKDSCANCHMEATIDGMKVSSYKNTHHKAGIKDCGTCHGKKKSDPNIRICEQCHNAVALHSVRPHTSSKACIGCHGDNLRSKKKKKKK